TCHGGFLPGGFRAWALSESLRGFPLIRIKAATVILSRVTVSGPHCMEHSALITDDHVILGVLLAVLAGVFATSRSERPWLRRFYAYVPALLLCYFIPGLLNTVGLIGGDGSGLDPRARDYLLRSSLVLLTRWVDLRGIVRVGPKAGILFL